MGNTGFKQGVRPAFNEQTIAVFFEKGTFLRLMANCVIDGYSSSDFRYSPFYCLFCSSLTPSKTLKKHVT